MVQPYLTDDHFSVLHRLFLSNGDSCTLLWNEGSYGVRMIDATCHVT